jgi:hypothetical protein
MAKGKQRPPPLPPEPPTTQQSVAPIDSPALLIREGELPERLFLDIKLFGGAAEGG